MKIVKERIDEISRGNKDVLVSMNVGRYQMIKSWCENLRSHRISDDYTINDGMISAYTVDLSNMGLTSLPDYIKFDVVNYFFVDNNELATLDGILPRKVTTSLSTWGNKKYFKVSYIEKICDVSGAIVKTSEGNYDPDIAKKYRDRAKSYGKIQDRSSHLLGTYASTTGEASQGSGLRFSSGYKMYNLLKFVAKSSDAGRKWSELSKFVFLMSYPNRELDWTRGYWSVGITRLENEDYIEKTENEAGKKVYVITNKGLDYIENSKSLFEK